MDTLTKTERSERMARIRGKDTKPELRLRRLLHGRGYRFRLHRKDLPGTPDLVFPSRKKVIFVHGCFWHAHENCKVANLPKSRRAYWQKKFDTNRRRDQKNIESLKQMGWDVFVAWECQVNHDSMILNDIEKFLGAPGDSDGAGRVI